jgi:hypothetical protein
MFAMPGPFRQLITDKVVRDAIKKAGFSNVSQQIYDLIPMGSHLLVAHDLNLDTGAMQADVFDGKGSYLGSTPLPKVDYHFFSSYYNVFAKLTFRIGLAYGLLREDGDFVLKRYRVALFKMMK